MPNNKALKENLIHGEIMFPLCVYGGLTAEDKQLLFCHWHEEVEFIYLNK
jgi:hypothetical protein